jgi:hypothetical protein
MATSRKLIKGKGEKEKRRKGEKEKRRKGKEDASI